MVIGFNCISSSDMYCNRVVIAHVQLKSNSFLMPQCHEQQNILGYVHSPSVEAWHRPMPINSTIYVVANKFSYYPVLRFAGNCGIFLLEIYFLKVLYIDLSRMIYLPLWITYISIDHKYKTSRHSSVPHEIWLVSVMMKHLV